MTDREKLVEAAFRGLMSALVGQTITPAQNVAPRPRKRKGRPSSRQIPLISVPKSPTSPKREQAGPTASELDEMFTDFLSRARPEVPPGHYKPSSRYE